MKLISKQQTLCVGLHINKHWLGCALNLKSSVFQIQNSCVYVVVLCVRLCASISFIFKVQFMPYAIVTISPAVVAWYRHISNIATSYYMQLYDLWSQIDTLYIQVTYDLSSQGTVTPNSGNLRVCLWKWCIWHSPCSSELTTLICRNFYTI